MATLTLRNVPDDLVARLKLRAKQHRRSLNSETIASLELADAAAAGLAASLPLQGLDRDAGHHCRSLHQLHPCQLHQLHQLSQ